MYATDEADYLQQGGWKEELAQARAWSRAWKASAKRWRFGWKLNRHDSDAEIAFHVARIAELEEMLHQLADFDSCAIVEVPHDFGGQLRCAYCDHAIDDVYPMRQRPFPHLDDCLIVKARALLEGE